MGVAQGKHWKFEDNGSKEKKLNDKTKEVRKSKFLIFLAT